MEVESVINNPAEEEQTVCAPDGETLCIKLPADIVIFTVASVVPQLLAARVVYTNGPVTGPVGVPLISPVALFSERPAGNAGNPEGILKLVVRPPVLTAGTFAVMAPPIQ